MAGAVRRDKGRAKSNDQLYELQFKTEVDMNIQKHFLYESMTNIRQRTKRMLLTTAPSTVFSNMSIFILSLPCYYRINKKYRNEEKGVWVVWQNANGKLGTKMRTKHLAFQ
jgi:hypothetical protein